MNQLFGRLAREGHEVTVVTTFPHYEGFRTWKEYRGKLMQRDRRGDVEVLRVYSFTSGNKSMVHRLINYVTFNVVATLVVLALRLRFDLVFATNGSFFSGVSGRLLAWSRRVPLVLNLQDLYPDVPISQGQLTNPWAIAALRLVERWMYRRADHLTVITPSFSRRLATHGIPERAISVVPNFVDVDFVRPLPRDNDFSRANELDGRFVVSHAGNIGYVYDLEALIESAAILEEQTDLLILIVGEGVAKERLQQLAKRRGVGNVRFMPFVPTADLPWLRASSDVQVSLYKSGAADYSMPSKIYEIMASGRPVLASADRDTDIRDLVERTGCGMCVDPGDSGALADALGRLRADPQLRAEMGARGRAAATELYSAPAVTAKYKALFADVVSAASSRGG